MNKKAFFTMHPGLFFVAGLLIGAALMYFLLSKGIITTNLI
ncbi:MAG: hypothetical protein AABX74_06055 [Nanoarchaeota archaeon]